MHSIPSILQSSMADALAQENRRPSKFSEYAGGLSMLRLHKMSEIHAELAKAHIFLGFQLQNCFSSQNLVVRAARSILRTPSDVFGLGLKASQISILCCNIIKFNGLNLRLIGGILREVRFQA